MSSLFKGPEIVGDHIDNLLDYINGLIDPYSMEPREQDPNVY